MVGNLEPKVKSTTRIKCRYKYIYLKLYVKPYVYSRTPNRLQIHLIDWLCTGHKLLDEFNCARIWSAGLAYSYA